MTTGQVLVGAAFLIWLVILAVTRHWAVGISVGIVGWHLVWSFFHDAMHIQVWP
mgnify:CR=1 FL=1